jgi:hypothetical protein
VDFGKEGLPSFLLRLFTFFLYLFLVQAPATAAPAIANGDFASGLDFWNVLGGTLVTSTGQRANLSTGGSNNSASLATFLGVSQSQITSLNASTRDVFNGSAMSQVVGSSAPGNVPQAGSQLQFNWMFETNEPPGRIFNFRDYAFVSISRPAGGGFAALSQVVKLSDTVSLGGGLFSLVLPSDGPFTLGFGILNVGNNNFSSVIRIDSVTIGNVIVRVPELNLESALLPLVLAGFALLLVQERRPRSGQTR